MSGVKGQHKKCPEPCPPPQQDCQDPCKPVCPEPKCPPPQECEPVQVCPEPKCPPQVVQCSPVPQCQNQQEKQWVKK